MTNHAVSPKMEPGSEGHRETQLIAGAPGKVVLTSDMKYAEAKGLLVALWPRLRITVYRSTVPHFKEGYPTAEELELGAEEEMCRTSGREAVLRGDMTGQDLNHAIMKAFSLDTEIAGGGIHGVWRTKLDET